MQRVPKGQYVRDTWDWLGSDACWALGSRGLSGSTAGGVMIRNESKAGEVLDFRLVTANLDMASQVTLEAVQVPTGLVPFSPSYISYLDVVEGAPPCNIYRYGGPLNTNLTIFATQGLVTDFVHPRVDLGRFIRLPSNWGLGFNAQAGANPTNFSVCFYFQIISETDLHTGNPYPLPARRH